jgi:hypothetical protein
MCEISILSTPFSLLSFRFVSDRPFYCAIFLGKASETKLE